MAVLPEARDIRVEVSERDLKWEYMRASGAGGQGVNTADSAVRLTHLPSSTVVESQEERAQAQNKKRALKKLQNILYQAQWEKDQKKVASSRKLQVGNMNRNEKIRTYNFNRLLFYHYTSVDIESKSQSESTRQYHFYKYFFISDPKYAGTS